MDLFVLCVETIVAMNYATISLILRWPYECQARWVKRRKGYSCQFRTRMPDKRWSAWLDAA
jgi:hypothetical protein